MKERSHYLTSGLFIYFLNKSRCTKKPDLISSKLLLLHSKATDQYIVNKYYQFKFFFNDKTLKTQ